MQFDFNTNAIICFIAAAACLYIGVNAFLGRGALAQQVDTEGNRTPLPRKMQLTFGLVGVLIAAGFAIAGLGSGLGNEVVRVSGFSLGIVAGISAVFYIRFANRKSKRHNRDEDEGAKDDETP